ncbi:helicase-exonuclease AddAB subunit AddA [Paenibacillus sp. CGMCC 1.16610]|uniref:ATP-dependent helicase/nuclease subunit A n=1 Tax=Paenibacillus anseongense TaxID=2682845 RepID=A0ABW9UCN2_9BACL|nr:helicase-exonuclease AddAB subunit AddA [Paenibacillus sp. CGMCC 1.16610]MVQ37211.1 helicase-exonuclease AddAB subunit AddA [Paenibacillus anseongense]
MLARDEDGKECNEVNKQQQPKPPGSTWTDDQWDAITLKGQNMLVAAAAGSGKTAVLVERIIRRISDEWEPIDVDRLLVATFTKAAASEMKHRIREALEKELMKQPHSQHLRKQIALMGRASITTLHSFCLEVVQRYFSLIRLDPGFRIANETEAELMRQDLLGEMLEEYYAASGENSAFWRLVDSFSGERNDDAIMQLIQKLYDVSRSHPWPEHWLRATASMFGAPEPAPQEVPDEAAAVIQEALPYVAAASAPADYGIWEQSLIRDLVLELEGAADLLRQAIEIADSPGGPAPYLDNLREDLLLVNNLLETTTYPWSVLYRGFQTVEFGKLKACKGDDYDKAMQEEVKELRNKVKEQINKMQEELFGRTPEQFHQEIAEMAPLLHTLVDLVADFGHRYQAGKQAKGLIDFADLEHYCLQILSAPGSIPGELVPSEAAQAYRKQFAEVLLDEYQDTNRVQEAIVELISNANPGNRFMVGDVKQSIYRFRLAEPGLFLEKYKAYRSNKDEPLEVTSAGGRIDLARNFRSRIEVVDAVNFIFKQMMNETVGEVAYDERAELVYGAGYPPSVSDCSVEMLIIDRGTDAPDPGESYSADSEENEEMNAEASPEGAAVDPALEAQELETAQLEARTIARQIQGLMGTGGKEAFQVFDKRTGGDRPVTYRDIVILLRATQMWSPILIEELKKMGIPAYAELSTGYFSATEVEVMLSLLKVIDNPYQDVPLAAVLRSPVVQLTAEDLAQIRIADKSVPFYDSVLQAAGSEKTEENEVLLQKLNYFLELLETWRTEARQGSLADLIWHIYRQTGYYDFAGGLPGGVQRQANLRALYDRARQYESTSLRGLFRFLRFIERMKESGGDLGTARALGEQEDVVRIMSIHKSKGLEFPVVFVAGMAKMFNQRDLNDSFLLHKELGFGPRFVDTTLRVSYPTLPSLAIKRRMKLELLAEEMRVLYVALTRAREKLYLLGTVKSLDKLLRGWGRHLSRTEWYLPDFELAKAKSYLDWVGPALLRHPHAGLWRERLGISEASSGVRLLDDPSAWKLTVIKPESLLTDEVSEEHNLAPDGDRMDSIRRIETVTTSGEWQEWLDDRLSWSYSFPEAPKLFAKTTVSEMKRLSELNRISDEMEMPVATEVIAPGAASPTSGNGRSMIWRRPKFMEEKKLSAAEKGTVVHAVMQNLSLQEAPTEASIRGTLQEMLTKQTLTAEQSEVVDIPIVLRFFETGVGQRMLQARNVQREVPFSYGLQADEVYTGTNRSTSGETVLIQGVIDCLFEDELGLVLVDYKTDAVKGSSDAELKLRYEQQISLYTCAVEHIWKRPVNGKFLYFFDGAKLLEM